MFEGDDSALTLGEIHNQSRSCQSTVQRAGALLRVNPKAVRWGWRVMRRNPGVYARGTVRHSDHDTITLSFWHRVVMNTETQSRTMANVAFLD